MTMVDYGFCQSEICWGTASPWPMDQATVRKVCQGIADIGGSRLRMGIQVGTWADLDFAVNTAVEFGLKPLLCILGNEALQAGSQTQVVPFAALCKAVALRYGPAGTNQVSEYEIFNEMNASLNPPKNNNPAFYVEFLKAAYTAIKSVHTSSTVISGGTIPSPTFDFFVSSKNPVDWYTGVYAAGGKNYMDAVGFHWYFEHYPVTTDVHWTYLASVRALMVANGDTAKKIWITEVGAGYPGQSGVTSMVNYRDFMKLLVDEMLSRDYLGPFYLYNFRNSTSDVNDASLGNYGVVTYDFVPREPYYSYAKTIRGTPSDPGDITPPTRPTNVTVTGVTVHSAIASWNPAMDDVGVSVYRIYDANTHLKIAETSHIGQISTPINLLTSGTPYDIYVTALDAAGHESPASDTASFTTEAPSGLEQTYAYDFADSPSVPTVFTQLALGFTVTSGVALPNAAATDGDYYTVAPYVLDQQSPDHSSEITQSVASAYSDRYAMTAVRMSADGSQFVAAFISGNGQTDACRIVTRDSGVITLRDAVNASPLQPGEKLRLTPLGNVYTVARVSGGEATDLLTWTDYEGVYTGRTNVRAGLVWRHKRVGSINYPAVGVATWKAFDLNPTTARGGSGFDAWMLGIVDDTSWGELISTGSWESLI